MYLSALELNLVKQGECATSSISITNTNEQKVSYFMLSFHRSSSNYVPMRAKSWGSKRAFLCWIPSKLYHWKVWRMKPNYYFSKNVSENCWRSVTKVWGNQSIGIVSICLFQMSSRYRLQFNIAGISDVLFDHLLTVEQEQEKYLSSQVDFIDFALLIVEHSSKGWNPTNDCFGPLCNKCNSKSYGRASSC